MASPQGAKVSPTRNKMRTPDGTVVSVLSPLGNKISARSQPMISLTVKEWRQAIDTARQLLNPRRRLLTDICRNVLFDGHLQAVMEKRKLAITNKKMSFTGADGKNDDKVQQLILDQQWFSDFLYHSMSAIDYEFSLVELVPGADGLIGSCVQLPHTNVLPDYRYLAWSYNTQQPADGAGIYYLDDPEYAETLIEVRSKYPLGKLSTASLLIILKRGSLSDWADFCQIVGIPTRVGYYNPNDDYSRKKMQEGFDEQGSAGYIILPEGSKLEMLAGATAGQSDVFKHLFDECNSELSKLYLGQTMTTDDGASRSQGQVHKSVEEEINVSDMIWAEHVVNNQLVPKLIKRGYKIPEGRIHFPETSPIPLENRIKIDVELNKMIPMGDEYFYNTYGIPTPTPEEAAEWKDRKASAVPVSPFGNPAPEPDPSKKKVKAEAKQSLSKMYKVTGVGRHLYPVMAGQKKIDKIFNRIVEEVHAGTRKPGQIDRELHNHIYNQLFAGVEKGVGDKLEQEAYAVFVANLKTDVRYFSAYKSYQEQRTITDLLHDDKGEKLSLSEFKDACLRVNDEYNIAYAAAEYNQADAASQMGLKWQDFEANAEALPYATIRTAGDDRVREEHAALEGFTAPLADFDQIPPFDWGCRCDLEQTFEAPAENKSFPDIGSPAIFQVNWGKEQVVFPPDHPYYNVAKEDKKDVDNYLK